MTGGILNLLSAVAASAVVLAAFALMAVRRRTPAPHPEPEEAPLLNPLATVGWSTRPRPCLQMATSTSRAAASSTSSDGSAGRSHA
jgi:hypothetical protein